MDNPERVCLMCYYVLFLRALVVQFQKWYHFDINGTPCARDSLIYGIYGGGLGGIAYFFKSRNKTMSMYNYYYPN